MIAFIGYEGSTLNGGETIVKEKYVVQDEWGSTYFDLEQTMHRGGAGMGWGDMSNKTLNLAASICSRQIGFIPNESVYRQLAEILLADIEEVHWTITRERVWEALHEITGIKESSHEPRVRRVRDAH